MLTKKSTSLSSSTVIMDNKELEMRYRQTKIIFTIGPATSIDEILKELIKERVDICRINMAHANHEWTRGIIQQIKRVCNEAERHIAIMMDIKGPEIRTGDIGDPIYLEPDQVFSDECAYRRREPGRYSLCQR
jgi:pyruvate kinase